MLGRAFQTCNIDSKNCSELLMTNRMGLDRAPVEFQKLVFFETPYSSTLISTPTIMLKSGQGNLTT